MELVLSQSCVSHRGTQQINLRIYGNIKEKQGAYTLLYIKVLVC